MSNFQKIWDKELDMERRTTILSYYFCTDKTIEKHCKKEWRELPRNFKAYIIKNSARQMLEV